MANFIKWFVLFFPTLSRMLGIPYVQALSGVPVGHISNGTVATNGIITLVTALPTTYSGGIWLRLPAGAIVGGAAGMYWAVMSSTTQGQVYTNFADPASEFIPRVPTGPLVAAVGSNVAYTQTTGADVTLANVTNPGGSIGANGSIAATVMFQHNNSAGSKILKYNFGGVNILSRTRTTSLVEGWGPVSIRNMGSQNRNVSLAAGVTGTTSNNFNVGGTSAAFTTIDTSVNQSITFTGQLAVATDFIILHGFEVSVKSS